MILLRRIKRYMKIKHKKVAASGIAVALAGVLGVGALLQTSVSVQASSAMMPGIEEIVSEASADKPFKILEIVDNTQDAEIAITQNQSAYQQAAADANKVLKLTTGVVTAIVNGNTAAGLVNDLVDAKATDALTLTVTGTTAAAAD